MAKVTGPLMSMDARGKYAGALVFGAWKGRNVVRQLVTPANPQSTNQMAARNAVSVTAAAQKFARLATTVRSGTTGTDLEQLKNAAPSGQAWNGTLVKGMIGAGSLTFNAASTAWTALSSSNHTTWDTAAAALAPPFPPVAQKGAGGVAAPSKTAGEGYFIYTYGLFSLGLATLPGATPPTRA